VHEKSLTRQSLLPLGSRGFLLSSQPTLLIWSSLLFGMVLFKSIWLDKSEELKSDHHVAVNLLKG